MRIKIILVKEQGKIVYGVNPSNTDLYFCAHLTRNHKTKHLLNHLLNNHFSWISTEGYIDGTILSAHWIEVGGEIENWLTEKVETFRFLSKYEVSR